MTGLAKVIRNLDKDGILVIDTPLKANKALSLERGKIIAFDNRYFDSSAELCTALIHEGGHFESGAFYSPYSPYQIKEQAEYRADRSAILRYIPYEEMAALLRADYQLWELAEYFGVTEEYMLKAYLYYKDRYGAII